MRAGRAKLWRALLAVTAMGGAVAAGLLRLAPSGADNADGFDTQRALGDLRAIASEPHPTGSPADRRVLAFLAERLRALGLQVRVQPATWRPQGKSAHALVLQNVVARLAGTDGGGAGGAVLLCAHHDSVRAGPGAADDGAAVAALLEVARVLAQHPPQRDVLLLFTDAEEAGLLGARAFVAGGPWRSDVAVVLNFDARGTSGPAAMFETSDANAALIEQYARCAPHPVTTSLAGDIYRRMPNRTDFTVFKSAGMAGLNFAFLGSFQNYHHATDDLAHLSVRSLRHEGQTALALARCFGSGELPSARQDAVYFDLWSLGVVRYGTAWAMPLAAATAAGAVALIAAALRRRRASVSGMLGGVVLAGLGIAFSGALTYAVVAALGFRWAAAGFDWICAAAVVYAAALAATLLWLTQRWVSAVSVGCGAVGAWAAVGLWVSWVLPGASYLFVFPVWLVMAGLWIVIGGRARGWAGFLIATALAAAALGMNVGHLYLAALGLEADGLHWIVAAMAALLWLAMPVAWAGVVGDSTGTLASIG